MYLGIMVYLALVWHASAKTDVPDLLYRSIKNIIFQNAEIKLSKLVKQWHFLLQNSLKIKLYLRDQTIFS